MRQSCLTGRPSKFDAMSTMRATTRRPLLHAFSSSEPGNSIVTLDSSEVVQVRAHAYNPGQDGQFVLLVEGKPPYASSRFFEFLANPSLRSAAVASPPVYGNEGVKPGSAVEAPAPTIRRAAACKRAREARFQARNHDPAAIRSRFLIHGKEGVAGSSPAEGLAPKAFVRGGCGLAPVRRALMAGRDGNILETARQPEDTSFGPEDHRPMLTSARLRRVA